MDNSVLASTFLLTLLLLVGLVFFIRASVKERTQVVELVSDQPQASVLQQLMQHFSQRAYRVAVMDDAQQQVTLEGWVRPSFLLALFLTGLAAIGGLCLSLVLSILFSQFSQLFLGLVLLSPIAGIFYWRRAARPETVVLKVTPSDAASLSPQTLVTVTAHRDELAELQRCLPLKLAE